MANRPYLAQAQACLEQTLNRYRSGTAGPPAPELDEMAETLDTLSDPVVRIAVFGLVSRGKSAVINALVGKKLLKTGPIHGVTQWPRSVYWSPTDDLKVELVDTPGLGEVAGSDRAAMAETVIEQADLVLFITAGDLTQTEYAALEALWRSGKPLLLVFNKIDQYPDQDQRSIAQALRERALKAETALHQESPSPEATPRQALALNLRPQDIVLIAADPAPVQVQVEWPDGRTTHEWETPPADIEPLRQRLLTLLRREGEALVALRALHQAQQAETAIAQKNLSRHQHEADDLIWKFAQWKSAIVALNPVAGLDLVGGALSDLVLIRSLARLYGLPMTSHGAQDLWNAILWSSGSLLAGEVGSGLILGFGKSATAALTAISGGLSGVGAYASTAAAQGALAGYGAYRVGKAAQIYLENGCTWGPNGIHATMAEIFSQIDADSVLSRLRQGLP